MEELLTLCRVMEGRVKSSYWKSPRPNGSRLYIFTSENPNPGPLPRYPAFSSIRSRLILFIKFHSTLVTLFKTFYFKIYLFYSLISNASRLPFSLARLVLRVSIHSVNFSSVIAPLPLAPLGPFANSLQILFKTLRANDTISSSYVCWGFGLWAFRP